VCVSRPTVAPKNAHAPVGSGASTRPDTIVTNSARRDQAWCRCVRPRGERVGRCVSTTSYVHEIRQHSGSRSIIK
jgi:hypothetical protein